MQTKTVTAAQPPPASVMEDNAVTITYTVSGRQFIVEPVFKAEGETTETVPSILLKLMLEQG